MVTHYALVCGPVSLLGKAIFHQLVSRVLRTMNLHCAYQRGIPARTAGRILSSPDPVYKLFIMCQLPPLLPDHSPESGRIRVT